MNEKSSAIRTEIETETSHHEHAWMTESRHATSEGIVVYVRCSCGVRRIDVQHDLGLPPTALSRATPLRVAE